MRPLELTWWCRCRVPLSGVACALELAASECCCWKLCVLWSWLAGAAMGCHCTCCFRVLLSEGCARLRSLSAATQLSECGVRCEAWVVVPLRRVEMSMAMAVWALGPDGDYVYAVS